MPNHNCITVNKETEKRLFRICKELENKGKSTIEGFSPEYHGTMRKLGIRTKDLIEKELFKKPLISVDSNKVIVKRVIELPPNVIIKSNGNKKVKFFFKKKGK